MVKYWYINWTDYGRLSAELAKRIHASGVGFDLVIGIARGGIPLAMVIADALAVRIDMINVKSYTGIGKRGRLRVLSTLTGGVRGRRILIVDDLVDAGETMKKITKYIKLHEPAMMKTAVLFKKPWSTFDPDFYLKETDKWVVFPWDIGETRRLRAKSRRKGT